ncbi:MAG: DUF2877 domain-containing protein [Pedococcus sp.]
MSATWGATTWPAAVSERSASLLAAPARAATVLAAFPQALYLRLPDDVAPDDRAPDDRAPSDRVLPVVSVSGLRLPTAMVLATDLPTVGWGVQPGDDVAVGDGEVHLPQVRIRGVRLWRPAQVPCADRPLDPGAVRALTALASPTPVEAARSLVTTVLAGQDVTRQVSVIVGAGPGLTPSGDDVLCGALIALRLGGASEARARLWSAVTPRLGSTTSLSAALLAEAADGYAVPAVVRLAAALAGGTDTAREVGPAAREVLGVGHTSGADLLSGLSGGLVALRCDRTSAQMHTPVLQPFSTANAGVRP